MSIWTEESERARRRRLPPPWKVTPAQAYGLVLVFTLAALLALLAVGRAVVEVLA